MQSDRVSMCLRIERQLREKFRYAACYQGLCINSALLICVTEYVAQFERAQGEISQAQIGPLHREK